MTLIITELKAIDTRYNGNLYRSRLEARWAVFMDKLNIKFFYEHEGYDLGDGIWYLPDFWLPTFCGGSFLEVKPIDFNELEIEKAKRLVLESKKSLIFAIGLPDFKCQKVLYFDECATEPGLDYYIGLMNANKAYFEDRMFSYPSFDTADLTILSENYACCGDFYMEAVKAAKEARF